MEQERDYVDKIIEESFEDIAVDLKFGDQYNVRLLSKLHGENTTPRSSKTRTAAISLITAGILMGFLYTTQVQYGIENFQCKIKTDFAIMKHSMNLDKYFLGE